MRRERRKLKIMLGPAGIINVCKKTVALKKCAIKKMEIPKIKSINCNLPGNSWQPDIAESL